MQLGQISHRNSIFFFGLTPELAENPYIINFKRNGLATLVPDSLPRLMSELSIEFPDDEGYSSFNESSGVTIFIERKSIKLDSPREKDLLLNIQGFARLLCYEDVEQKDRFPQEEKIHRLQIFLQGSTAGFPRWYGYRDDNKFHIKRYFEDDLYDKTIKMLKDAGSEERKEKPIMLCGQAGSGKTNALGALSYRIFKEQIYPVIYIPDPDIQQIGSVRQNNAGELETRPSNEFSHLEQLIRQIESKTHFPKPTLIIWDTSCRMKSELNKANELLQYLRSAGRQVQIVCTSYINPKNDGGIDGSSKYETINVDIALTEEEFPLVKNLLVNSGEFSKDEADRMMQYYGADENFFASLYLFRELHIDLKRKLSREVRGQASDVSVALEELEEKYQKDRIKPILQLRIREYAEKFGGAITEYIESYDRKNESDEAWVKKTEEYKKRQAEIICCVAFCTIYKERFPISMMMHILGLIELDSAKVFGAIINNSLFYYAQTEDEEPLVYIRSELEAELLLEVYEKTRMEIVFILLDNVSSLGNSYEARMMQNIFHLIGANGPESHLKLWNRDNCENFKTLYKYLKKFREDNNCFDFFIQELTLVREICREQSWLPEEEKRQVLKEYVEIASLEVEKISLSKIESYEENLIIEYASLNRRLSDWDSTYNTENMFRRIKPYLDRVIQVSPYNGYAYSTYLWVGIRYARDIKDSDSKLEFLQTLCEKGDILEGEISEIDPYIDTNPIGELDALIDGLQINNDRFEKSVRDGRSYGIYFRVRKLIGGGCKDERINFARPQFDDGKIRKRYEEILQLLDNENYREIVENDPNCLYVLINIKWLIHAKQPIIPPSEDQCIGLSQRDWGKFYRWCDHYLTHFNRVRSPKMVYLFSLCAAHLVEHRNECEELFKELRNISFLPKRSYHVLSDDKGNPLKFKGRLSGNYDLIKRRGYIIIENGGFNKPIYFRAEKVGLPESSIMENMQFSDLSVATSYTGFKVCKL
jgi:energy-coupling factor transporter ATP-binding protein EcfA2